MPEITIGAVGAAAIAALISLLGLIISKEHKTSEFRQAWIDSLRSEITTYLTHLNAIADAARLPHPSQAEKVRALAPHYTAMNESAFSIALRLNRSEERSTKLMMCMKEFQDMALNEQEMRAANIRPIEGRLLLAAQDLLKFEWKRVKQGELTFRWTKYLSVALVASSAIYLSALALSDGLIRSQAAETKVEAPEVPSQKRA